MYIVIYDPITKRPSYTAEQSDLIKLDFFKDQGLSCFLSETANISNQYVENDTLVSMKAMSLGYEPTGLVGQEHIITGVPDNTEVSVDGVSMGLINDGMAEFTFDDVAEYHIMFKNEPRYVTTNIMVNIGNEI